MAVVTGLDEARADILQESLQDGNIAEALQDGDNIDTQH
jgi:hypothetical protein